MKIAYILYNGLTTLDFIGVYDPLSRLRSLGFLPDLEWDLCSLHGSIYDHFGLEINTPVIAPPLERYDAIIIPGGHSSREMLNNPDFMAWLRTAAEVPYKISVCTGSLLLGAAGFLKGKKGTTHFNEYPALQSFADEVIEGQIVEDGGVITAGAVAASLELGLYLCDKWAGAGAMKAIAKSMNYPPLT